MRVLPPSQYFSINKSKQPTCSFSLKKGKKSEMYLQHSGFTDSCLRNWNITYLILNIDRTVIFWIPGGVCEQEQTQRVVAVLENLHYSRQTPEGSKRLYAPGKWNKNPANFFNWEITCTVRRRCIPRKGLRGSLKSLDRLIGEGFPWRHLVHKDWERSCLLKCIYLSKKK